MPKKKITTRIKEGSWQTSAAGLLATAGALANIYGNAMNRPDIALIGQQAALLFGGGGLILAKDAGK